MSTILIVEDNELLRQSITDRLQSEQYQVFAASDGMAAEQILETQTIDLIIMDIMLPGKSGFEVTIKFRRKNTSVPVLFLSAKSSIADKVSALRLGGNDYVTKPFDFEELIARIEVLLRKSQPQEVQELPVEAKTKTVTLDADSPNQTAATKTEEIQLDKFWETLPDFNFGPFSVNCKTLQFFKNTQEVALSFMEFKLLACFYIHKNQVVTAEYLLDKVWGYEADVSQSTVYTHVYWLRKKLQNQDSKNGYIETVRNVGYRFVL